MNNNCTFPFLRFTLRYLTITFLVMIAGQLFSQQTLWLEEFDGGSSTTGFWIDTLNTTDCRWEYAPDSVGTNDFTLDINGEWPAGEGFDSSFVFLDSDACGGTSVVVDSYITSAPFDAGMAGDYWLHYSHQFRARLASFCRVEASPDGINWIEVAYYTTDDEGYPNPTTRDSADLTTALASSATAQVRFQFNSGWDWWWALDSISVVHTPGTVSISGPIGKTGMDIYPNPVNDRLNIKYNGQNARFVELHDMVGRIVLREAYSRLLNLSAVPAGSYSLILLDEQNATLDRKQLIRR